MNPRTRSLAALALTLIIGLILGLLLGGRLAARRFDRLAAMAYPPHLMTLLHESLELDAGQQNFVDSLLEAQAGLMSERMREHRRYLRGQVDSLLSALRPHLSEEQWARLQDQLAKPPRRGRPGWGRPGGGPPDGLGPDGPGRRRHWRQQAGRDIPPDSLDVPPPPPPGDRP